MITGQNAAFRKTKKGVITTIYGNQRAKSRRRGHDYPSYTNKELFNFAMSSKDFHLLYCNWVKSGYDKYYKPSFDRLDDYKGYTFANFRKWCTWNENAMRGYNDKKNGVNNKHSKAVIQLSIEGIFINSFYSSMDAERKTGADHSYITKVCKNKRKHAYGFIWKYAVGNFPI